MNANSDKGAWLVAVYKGLSQSSTNEPALDPLEAVIKAGRAAKLFSALRAAGRIDAEKLKSIASNLDGDCEGAAPTESHLPHNIGGYDSC
jgi:hypothetical protein